MTRFHKGDDAGFDSDLTREGTGEARSLVLKPQIGYGVTADGAPLVVQDGRIYLSRNAVEGDGHQYQRDLALLAGQWQVPGEGQEPTVSFDVPRPVGAARSGDVGLKEAPVSFISGIVWNDADLDGVRQEEELGVSGALVTLTRYWFRAGREGAPEPYRTKDWWEFDAEFDETDHSVLSKADGTWSFDNLPTFGTDDRGEEVIYGYRVNVERLPQVSGAGNGWAVTVLNAIDPSTAEELEDGTMTEPVNNPAADSDLDEMTTRLLPDSGANGLIVLAMPWTSDEADETKIEGPGGITWSKMAAQASVANDAGIARYDSFAIDGWAWNDLEKDGVQVGGEDRFAGERVYLQRRAMDANAVAQAGVGSTLGDGAHGSHLDGAGNPVTAAKRVLADPWSLTDQQRPDPDAADREAAAEVDGLIDAIGKVELTDECRAAIQVARKAYDRLTDKQKTFVTKADALEAAEAAYKALEEGAGKPEEPTEADRQAAADVDALIEVIGTVELTDACKDAIDAAREAFDGLTELQQGLVEKLDVLEAAESAYGELEAAEADRQAAAAVDGLIDAIGPVELTDECKAAIDAARSAYDALTDGQKALVEKLDALEAAESAYEALEAADPGTRSATVSGFAIARGLERVASLIATFADGDPADPDEADRQAAAAVDVLIGAIGEVELTDECKAAIDAARSAYDALTAPRQALVTKLAVLEAAEAAYEQLKEEAANRPAPEPWEDVTSMLTDGEGYYRFDDLPVTDEYGKPYEYRIRMVNPDGSEYIAAVHMGSDDNADNDLHPADGTADSAGMGYSDPLAALLKRGHEVDGSQATGTRVAATDINGGWAFEPTAYGQAFYMLDANDWTRGNGQAVDPAFYLEPPEEPDEPTPVDPVQPDEPDPAQPDEPRKPAIPLPKPSPTPGWAPQTGDSIAMVLATMLVAAAAFTLLLVARRRRKQEDER